MRARSNVVVDLSLPATRASKWIADTKERANLRNAHYTTPFNGPTTCNVNGSHQAIKLLPGSPPTIEQAWCVDAGGVGSPIVTTTDGSSEAVVWIPGAEGDNHLHAYDGDTGAVIANVAIPLPTVRDASPKIRRYVPPIAAKGRIYVATDNSIAAFSP